MKSQIIKSLMVAILLLLETRSLRAWQTSGSGAAGTAPAVDPTVVPDDSALNGSSKTLPVPTEHRDSAFVWNIASRAYRNQDYEREKRLVLSEQQASGFSSLCRDYTSDWTIQLLKQRRTPDDGIIDAEETSRMMQAENYARMAKFRDDFMAILTDTQRDEVYRRTLKSGGAFAMLHPELQTRFQLTEEQVKEISEIRDKNWEHLSPHFMTATDPHYRTMAEPFSTAAWEKLTDDQKLQVEHFIAKIHKSNVAVADLAAQPERQSSSEVIEDSSSGPDAAAHLESRIARLREELLSLDRDVNPGIDDANQDAQTREARKQGIRELAEKSFDLRQQMQRLEAQRMKLRLQLIETNLDARERARESIIDRRTEELISGAAGPTSTQTAAPRPELQDVELFFFTAAYCGPCQQVTPLIKRLQDEGFPITIVDISADPEATRRHKIDRIPTCVLKFDGVEVRRLVGLVSEAELRKEFVRPAGKQQTSSVAVKSIPESNVDPKVSESSASISGSSGSTSRRGRNVRTPAEFVAELRKLRQAVSEHSTTQKAAADSLAQISRPLAELKAEGLPYADWNGASRESFRKKLEQDLESKTIALDGANRDRQLGWSEYQSQLRMLQFDIDEAKLMMEQLVQKLDRVKQLFAKGAVSSTEVQEVESPLAIAKINLQRAEELLKLYADIETQEPQLNPDALKSEK